MLVLHAHWQPPARPDENGTVLFWTETSAAPAEQNNPSQDSPAAGAQLSGPEGQSGGGGRKSRWRRKPRPLLPPPVHPFCAPLAESEEALRQLGWAGGGRQGSLILLLPTAGNLPRPSPHLVYDWPFDMRRPPRLARWQVQGLLLPPAAAMAVLLALPPDSDLPPLCAWPTTPATGRRRLGSSSKQWRSRNCSRHSKRRKLLAPEMVAIVAAIMVAMVALTGAAMAASIMPVGPPSLTARVTARALPNW